MSDISSLPPSPFKGLYTSFDKLSEKLNSSPKNQVKHSIEVGENGAVENRDVLLQRTPLKNISNFATGAHAIACTPKKSKIDYSNPLTPTSNFKLLSTVAAGLAYAEKLIKDENEDQLIINTCKEDVVRIEKDLKQKKCRKDKSLAIICEKLIADYPEYVGDDEDVPISLDAASAQLGVEKRRIYDILNILESLGMVKKIGKKQYRWYGSNRLVPALESLKSFAFLNNMDKIVQSVVVEETASSSIQRIIEPLINRVPYFNHFSWLKNEKSLSTLTRQFLALFLTRKEPVLIPLEKAAEILLAKEGYLLLCKKGREFKTKVRRLYDIANVLVAVKVLTREKKCGKPAFKYNGPELNDSTALPASADISFVRTRSENWDTSLKKSHSFVRRSSLQDVCKAAEIERTKFLCSMASSTLSENSNDSCFSFLSTGSADVSPFDSYLNDNDLPITPVKPSTSNLTMTSTPAPGILGNVGTERVDNNDSVENKESVNEENSEDSKLIKLSSEQQNTLLNSLNVSLEKGQVASLLISSVENESATKQDAGVLRKIVLPKHYFFGLDKKQSKLKMQVSEPSISVLRNKKTEIMPSKAPTITYISVPTRYTTSFDESTGTTIVNQTNPLNNHAKLSDNIEQKVVDEPLTNFPCTSNAAYITCASNATSLTSRNPILENCCNKVTSEYENSNEKENVAECNGLSNSSLVEDSDKVMLNNDKIASIPSQHSNEGCKTPVTSDRKSSQEVSSPLAFANGFNTPPLASPNITIITLFPYTPQQNTSSEVVSPSIASSLLLKKRPNSSAENPTPASKKALFKLPTKTVAKKLPFSKKI